MRYVAAGPKCIGFGWVGRLHLCRIESCSWSASFENPESASIAVNSATLPSKLDNPVTCRFLKPRISGAAGIFGWSWSRIYWPGPAPALAPLQVFKDSFLYVSGHQEIPIQLHGEIHQDLQLGRKTKKEIWMLGASDWADSQISAHTDIMNWKFLPALHTHTTHVWSVFAWNALKSGIVVTGGSMLAQYPTICFHIPVDIYIFIYCRLYTSFF